MELLFTQKDALIAARRLIVYLSGISGRVTDITDIVDHAREILAKLPDEAELSSLTKK